MSSDMNRLRCEVDPSTRNLHVDLAEWLRNLSDEEKQELAPLWSELAYDAMKEMLQEEWANETINPTVHKLRLEFLTSDAAPDAWRKAATALIRQAQQAIRDAERFESAFHELWRAWPREYIEQRPKDVQYIHVNMPSDADTEATITALSASLSEEQIWQRAAAILSCSDDSYQTGSNEKLFWCSGCGQVSLRDPKTALADAYQLARDELMRELADAATATYRATDPLDHGYVYRVGELKTAMDGWEPGWYVMRGQPDEEPLPWDGPHSQFNAWKRMVELSVAERWVLVAVASDEELAQTLASMASQEAQRIAQANPEEV